MPRGVPAAGHRKMKNRVTPAMAASLGQTDELPVYESDAEAEARIIERFDILDMMAEAAIDGDCRSLIVSGPGGLGKSFRIHKRLKDWDPNGNRHSVTKGFCKATGLYRLLYKHRAAGQVVVFDDCDSVLYDEICLNFLKAACDTSAEREISYSAEYNMSEDDGEPIPRSFIFEGSVIFISNVDWDAAVDRGHKLAPHLGAMISRSHYIDLGLKTKRDLLLRIKHVVADGALRDMDLTDQEQKEVIDFINENSDRLRELSVRILIKVANIRQTGNPKWSRIANVTCCRN